MLGSPILYLKGMRIMMFQLSGFYCIGVDPRLPRLPGTGKAHHIGALIIRIGVPLKGFP